MTQIIQSNDFNSLTYASAFDDFHDIFEGKNTVNCQADTIRKYAKQNVGLLIEEFLPLIRLMVKPKPEVINHGYSFRKDDLMINKYDLTIEQNIFLAKKTIVQNIYNSAKLEGCNVTFPDTQTIMDGVSVANLKMSDVECILNLRDAWRFLLEHIDGPFNLDFASKINSYVSRNESLEWGVLRNGRVGISGTEYIPPIPVKEEVEQEIDTINDIENATERAIRYFLWGMRSQLFWDGNKRTSTLCTNKILIKEGKGILSVKEQDLREFNQLLTQFYDTNNYHIIEGFVYEKCIKGIDF